MLLCLYLFLFVCCRSLCRHCHSGQRPACQGLQVEMQQVTLTILATLLVCLCRLGMQCCQELEKFLSIAHTRHGELQEHAHAVAIPDHLAQQCSWESRTNSHSQLQTPQPQPSKKRLNPSWDSRLCRKKQRKGLRLSICRRSLPSR